MLDLLKYRYVYLLISALIMIPGMIFMALGGLRPGIDFSGGTELTVVLPAGVRPSIGDVERLVASVSYTEQGHTVRLDDAHVQQVRDQRSPERQAYLIRTRDIGANVAAQSRQLAALKAHYGTVESLGFTTVSATVAALLHDVVVVLGLFAIAGYFFNVRIDALFVPAVLKVIGSSVHDTIVVFDRVRENLGRRSGE